MGHRSHRSKCTSKPDCKCFQCCEPPPQCKVIECPAFVCIVGDPDEETTKPLGTVFASASTGRLWVVTPTGVRELALVP